MTLRGAPWHRLTCEVCHLLFYCVRREKASLFSGSRYPPGKGSLQPVAIGAAAEATKPSESSMERVTFGDLASRQAVTRSERRAGLETDDAGADPFAITGKAAIAAGPSRNAKPVERHDSGGPAGVMATACLHRTTNATREVPTVKVCDLQPEAREGQIRAVRDGGEARSTDEAVNHRGGKGPWLKVSAESDEEQGDWR